MQQKLSENSLRDFSIDTGGRYILPLIRSIGGRSHILPIESQVVGIDTKIPGQEHLSSPGKGKNQILINSYERVPSPIFSAWSSWIFQSVIGETSLK